MLRVAMYINYERLRARRQNLQRLQEFDQVVLRVCWQSVECQALGESLTVVGFDRFARRGEFSMVHECSTLVVKAPKLPGDEFAVSCEKCGRACGLILVEGLAFRISCGVTRGADVMQLEIGISLHHNRPMMSLQARKRQRIARQVHGECRSTDRIVRGSEQQVW